MNDTRLLLLTAPMGTRGKKAFLSGLRRRGISVLGELPGSSRESLLTPRQTEVLRDMALGLRAKKIAKKLGVSIKTVETHRMLLKKRLGIRDVPALVRYALKSGVIPLSWLFS